MKMKSKSQDKNIYSDKTDFKTKAVMRGEKRHYIMINGLFPVFVFPQKPVSGISLFTSAKFIFLE